MKLNHPVGQAAETRALVFLLAQGYQLVARNWHCAHGEIDLIMCSGSTLIFVEVKYRRHTTFGGVAYSITPSKLTKLQRSVEQYLLTHPHRGQCRLDAVLLQDSASPHWIQNITG